MLAYQLRQLLYHPHYTTHVVSLGFFFPQKITFPYFSFKLWKLVLNYQFCIWPGTGSWLGKKSCCLNKRPGGRRGCHNFSGFSFFPQDMRNLKSFGLAWKKMANWRWPQWLWQNEEPTNNSLCKASSEKERTWEHPQVLHIFNCCEETAIQWRLVGLALWEMRE